MHRPAPSVVRQLLPPPPHIRRRHRGFALLITITLLAFLVLLLVSIASLTRVETRVAANTQHQAKARQNALLALNIALGQLQRHTGPDPRVTARADLVLPASTADAITPPSFNLSSGNQTATGTTGAQAAAFIEDHWAASSSPRNRHWTGVWRNTNEDPYSPDTPANSNPIPSAPVWLVSGSETPAPSDPNNPIDGLQATSSALDDTLTDRVTGAPHRLLVGRATTAAATAADLHRFVTAPQISIRATGVPGAAAGVPATVGHYAWWIGDEGIKARVNLVDPYAAAPDTAPIADPEHPHNLARRLSAQRLAAEALAIDPLSSDNALAGLAPFFTTVPDDATRIRVSDPRLPTVLVAAQFPYLLDNDVLREQLARRHHDVSTSSRGVLADVKNGGLKRDLTHILSRPTASAFRTALNTVSDGAPAYNVAPLATGNVALSPAATPYAEPPTHLSLASTVLDHSATWEQLWSHYNLGNATTDTPAGVMNAGVAQARLPSAAQQGLTPLLVQGKVFYRLRISGNTASVDTFPLVVLANPYPVPLSGDFIIRFTFSGSATPRVRVATSTDGSVPADNAFTNLGGDLTNAYLGNIQLVARAPAIPPGEAQIFTIDPSAHPVISGPADTRVVVMLNDYDPSTFLTYTNPTPIPADKTHVALHSGSDLQAHGYLDAISPQTKFAEIQTRESNQASDPSVGSGFRVYPFPITEGASRGGGGVFFTLHDGYTLLPQQSPFLQLNYRTMVIGSYGSTSSPGGGHPLQWAIRYSILGQPDQPYDDLPLPYYEANLLPPAGTGIPTTVRWGLVTTGMFPDLTSSPPEITGDVGFVNLLYDLPRPERPVTSIGQLQHFNLAGINPTTNGSDLKPNAWQLNYPIANSYATPRVARDLTFFRSPGNVTGSHYDGAYLWNDILWDRFTFSSFPQSSAFDFARPDHRLINARYRPFRDPASVPLDDPSGFRGLYQPAENLLVEGAFNINSTSVEAWKAVLSGLKDVPVGSETSTAHLTAPFPRVLSPVGAAHGAKEGATANAWNGFRNLTPAELHALAEELVLQVRLRGPFLSLADFVNRRLTPGRRDHTDPESDDRQRLGISGALQSAIDRAINQPADIPHAQFNAKTRAWATAGDKNPYYGDVDYRASTRIAGFPGYLLQGDVLSALGPTLTARSDTFTIRTYGDVTNPVTNTVEGRAWCEAVVQRLPDYLDPATPAADIPADGTPNATFGRRYHIVSFRWLSPSDI